MDYPNYGPDYRYFLGHLHFRKEDFIPISYGVIRLPTFDKHINPNSDTLYKVPPVNGNENNKNQGRFNVKQTVRKNNGICFVERRKHLASDVILLIMDQKCMVEWRICSQHVMGCCW